MLRSEIDELPLLHRGKVRETYAVGDDRLLLVATDRLSAFDVVFDQPIPDKGRVLTRLSAYWFGLLGGLGPTHFVSADPDRLPEPIFTPSTKAEIGHDENITREQLAELVGADLARQLEDRSLALYAAG